MVKKMLVVCWANTVWATLMCTCLQHWVCERARLLRSVEPQSQPLLWVQVYEDTCMCVCVFVTALFSRLGLGATACSSSSGLSFSFVSSCASLICESLHNMTLDFNLYLFILFSFGLFPPFSSAMLCSSLSPSDLHCHGRALGSILSMSCCALSVVAPRRH